MWLVLLGHPVYWQVENDLFEKQLDIVGKRKVIYSDDYLENKLDLVSSLLLAVGFIQNSLYEITSMEKKYCICTVIRGMYIWFAYQTEVSSHSGP